MNDTMYIERRHISIQFVSSSLVYQVDLISPDNKLSGYVRNVRELHVACCVFNRRNFNFVIKYFNVELDSLQFIIHFEMPGILLKKIFVTRVTEPHAVDRSGVFDSFATIFMS